MLSISAIRSVFYSENSDNCLPNVSLPSQGDLVRSGNVFCFSVFTIRSRLAMLLDFFSDISSFVSLIHREVGLYFIPVRQQWMGHASLFIDGSSCKQTGAIAWLFRLIVSLLSRESNTERWTHEAFLAVLQCLLMSEFLNFSYSCTPPVDCPV